MSTTPAIKNWSYPFEDRTENPLQQLTQLAKAKSGFYPIGGNGLWHGGVHFDSATQPSLGSSGVRCIADGEVIAYRIDSRYPISLYRGKIPLMTQASFSTGFVLIKHRLEPPANQATTSTPPSLTFYSLYMHVQDWAGYQATPSLPRPVFWSESIYRVETQGSNLNIRVEANTNSAILASLPTGTLVKVAPGEGVFRKLLSIVNGTSSPQLSPGAAGQLPGYLAYNFLRAVEEPPLTDQVVVLERPIAISAGELVGYPGRYQNQNDSSPQPLLHLEVFSCDDVPRFLQQSKAWAGRLPETQKTLLKVYAQGSKLITHRPEINAATPPKSSDPGTVVGVDLIIPQHVLDALPADCKIPSGTSAEGTITHWWRLDGLLADEEGQPINGWLAEQEPLTTRHSPWEWEGYVCIEDREPATVGLAYYLNALHRLTDSERASYQGLIDQADKGPVKSRLYDIIDTNRDGKLTPEEIRAALQKPWHAQSIAQVITRHESEWLWSPDKWDGLDELMGHSPKEPNPDWATEKERIQKLSWWSELSGKHGICADGVVWHFHPLTLISSEDFDLRELRVRAFLRMIRVGEGTVGISGYEKLFGGASFIKDYGKTFNDHPQIKIAKGKYVSSAAGAYQIMSYTWNDHSLKKIRKKYAINDFSPLSQDKSCVGILKHKVIGNTLDLIMSGKIREAIENSSWEWASLPPGRYGQPIKTMAKAMSYYEQYLEEEINGKSDLYLNKGFLKEFE